MISLYKPFMPPELPELNNILYSGYLTYGKYGKNFEERLSEYFNEKYVLVTNSYNLAIFIVLSTLDIKSGDEVIASPMACLASTQPIATYGAKIVWADIDPKRGTLSPESVKKKITSKTKAIIHNHFCGYVGYIDEINNIGKKAGIPVINDGIEGFGSIYKSKKIGNCGTDISVFSLNAVRIPNTIEGGVIIFKDKELYNKALLKRDNGINRSNFRDDLGEINTSCDISILGYSATMSEINSYIGLMQMNYVDELIKKQRNNAKVWSKVLSGIDMVTPIDIHDSIPNYWVYGVLTSNKKNTIEFFRSKGFYASGVHINNNIYSVFKSNEFLPGVYEFNNSFVALPSGWWVNGEKDIVIF